MGCRKKRACYYLDVEYRTLRGWEKSGVVDKRKGAKKMVANKLTEKEEKEIVKILGKERFCDLTPYEIVPILAENGKYIASVSAFYRILNKYDLLKHRRKSKKPGKHEIIELKATKPNQLLSWDISYLKTNIQGQFYYLYMILDVWSRVIAGWEVHTNETGEKAKDLFKKIAKERELKNAVLHSDNGGPMRSALLADTLENLNVTPSFSRPRVSNDNAYSESLFKTVKYTAGYPKSFKSLEEAREWVKQFVSWYNTEHRHSGIGYVTPLERHNGDDVEIFAKRNKVFEAAKAKHPERWSKNMKVWKKQEVVYLKKGNRKERA